MQSTVRERERGRQRKKTKLDAVQHKNQLRSLAKNSPCCVGIEGAEGGREDWCPLGLAYLLIISVISATKQKRKLCHLLHACEKHNNNGGNTDNSCRAGVRLSGSGRRTGGRRRLALPGPSRTRFEWRPISKCLSIASICLVIVYKRRVASVCLCNCFDCLDYLWVTLEQQQQQLRQQQQQWQRALLLWLS